MKEAIAALLIAMGILSPYYSAEAPEVDAAGLLEQEQFVYQTPTESEVYILAQALAGECYVYDLQDQRNACMVLLNRVDDSRWPSTLEAVIKQTGIYGYSPSNVPAQAYLESAQQALDDWYCLKAGGVRPWNYHIFFWSAVNGVNVYREVY